MCTFRRESTTLGFPQRPQLFLTGSKSLEFYNFAQTVQTEAALVSLHVFLRSVCCTMR